MAPAMEASWTGADRMPKADDQRGGSGRRVGQAQPGQDQGDEPNRQHAAEDMRRRQPADGCRGLVLQAKRVQAECPCRQPYPVADKGVDRP
jgi:hypothetical protein